MKYVVAYIATIPLANYLIGNIGTICDEHICLIPVGFGLMAPSGVLMIGIAFVLRDIVQRLHGIYWGLGCIIAGTLISALLSPPALVIASATAFALGELLDFAVYTPLQKRGFLLAVAASSMAASILDSILFLILAFGSVDYAAGQIVGKWIAVFFALPFVYVARAALEEKKDD